MKLTAATISAVLAVGIALGQGTPEMRVLVVDRVTESEGTLNRALAEAGRLFQAAGIAVRWIACTNHSADTPMCGDWRVKDPGLVALRITRSPKAELVADSALGFTIATTEGAAYASIFTDRVRQIASASGHPESMILGITIAHELGHVLLGGTSHAKRGLMSARWTRTELQQAELGLLRFSADECLRIRAAAARRRHLGISASDR